MAIREGGGAEMGKGQRLSAASGWAVAPEPVEATSRADDAGRLAAAVADIEGELAVQRAAAELLETELTARRADVELLEARKRELAVQMDETAGRLGEAETELKLLTVRQRIMDSHYVSSGGKIALAAVLKNLDPGQRGHVLRDLQCTTRSGLALRTLGGKFIAKRRFFGLEPRLASFQKRALGELSDLYLRGRLLELTYRTSNGALRTIPLDSILVRCDGAGVPIYRAPRTPTPLPKDRISLERLLTNPPTSLMNVLLGCLDTRSRTNQRLAFARRHGEVTVHDFLTIHNWQPPEHVSMHRMPRGMASQRALRNIMIPIDKRGRPVLLERLRR